MILMTPEQVAEEFGVCDDTVRLWVRMGQVTKHPRPPREARHGGHPGFWVARHEVVKRMEKVRPRDKRGGRRPQSPATPEPPTPPDPR